VGRGEAVPYARYGESVEGVAARFSDLPQDLDVATANRVLHFGAACNAIDCALHDLEAKRSGRSVAAKLGLEPLQPLTTAFTLSLDTPEAMAAKARSVPHLPLLKLKLGGGAIDAERMAAVRTARPDARLIADANEAWSENELESLLAAAAAARFELVEQPLPATADRMLEFCPHPVPVCADESAREAGDVGLVSTRYEAVNIKLDKAGGLTNALEMRDLARAAGMKIMVGSMVATSLAVAPAILLAQGADWVDLDGPLLLARDRKPAIRVEGAVMHPPEPELWG
jgi:L-alanine-DL-glutamate epimerase-like enolase superfamily enzyme